MTENSCYPIIHFVPQYGWLNDPNGLVWHDGVFELYYQSNPDGLEWADMTWSHARSNDLIHWEHLGAVMYPDENGMMYSGCGLRNEKGLLGLDQKALLFPYTAAYHGAGGIFEGKYTIRMAYSTDGGDTLIKKEGKILEETAPFNRDPKVFWHEESQAYILVLWIDKDEFGIWRSGDLEWFEPASRVKLEGGFECPDLYRLPVYDTDGKLLDEKKWVFWAADGSYYVGDFDGYVFSEQQDRMHACTTTLPYAAQSWSGDPEGRVISTAWLRMMTVAHQYTGGMSLPRELSLVKAGNRYLIRQSLPHEITDGSQTIACSSDITKTLRCDIAEDAAVRIRLDAPEDFSIDLKDAEGNTLVNLASGSRKGMLLVTIQEVTEQIRLGWMKASKDIDIIYDRGIIEVSADDDTALAITDKPSLRRLVCASAEISGQAAACEVSVIK